MTKKEGKRLRYLLAKKKLTQSEVDELVDLSEKLDVEVRDRTPSVWFPEHKLEGQPIEIHPRSQIDIFDEIIVDNFAGGGGASTGIELAAGRPVAIAINHDPDAILLHKTNHPYTEHLQASVWDVDPEEVCKGRHVGLAWFSPDCKHFSKAKGAALRDRNIRGLAWIVLRWAGTVRPDVIMLENVEEFQTWGPVRKGKPVKKKAGETFQKWKQQLSDLGYVIEHRELVAADYGAPTTRKRFVLVARCDGKPIVWPERTHAPRDSEEVRSGKCKPWRSAAEIIDWTLPTYSIFDSKQEIKEKYGVNAVRPLADNTLRRVIRGVDKFTIKSGKPFLVECNHSGDGHIRDISEPIGTVTAKHTGGVVQPLVAPWTVTNTTNSVGAPANEPVHTVTSAGNQILACAQLMSIGQTGGGDRIRDVRDPVPTTVSKQESCVVAANLIQYHTEQTENVRASGLDAPMQTVDAANRHGLVSAQLVEYYGNGNPLDVRELGRWPQIRQLLNKHCGYQLADDEIILLMIHGVAWFIADITLRMLTPRELYNAMGFPEDYQIERDYMGNEYPKSKQVARCGNAVCPPLAEAMVRANKPEWCSVTIVNMAQLNKLVAV